MNTDYKLFVISVISKEQSGYLNGYIELNIISIFDIIENVELIKSSAPLECIDFEKDFHKIDLIFIKRTMEKFGFDDIFKSWK